MARITAVLLALTLAACGETGGGPGDGEVPDGRAADFATDAGGHRPDLGEPDAAVAVDLAMVEADADPQADAGSAPDGSLEEDAGPATDGGAAEDAEVEPDGGGPSLCACDVTAYCEPGCECDIACLAEVGPPPLGPLSIGLERNEIAVFHPLDGAGVVNRVTLFDDSTADGRPRHPQLWTESVADWGLRPLVETRLRPKSMTADVDDDGREEAIVVTTSGVYVAAWNGVSMPHRLVYAYPPVDWFDAAIGDVDDDGGRKLVLTRQAGDRVTVEVLAIGPGGDAFVRATTEVSGVVRHAVAVAAPAAGEAPLIFLLTSQLVANRVEPLEVIQYRLDDAELVETNRLSLDPLCSFSHQGEVPDDGMALQVGELTDSVGNELFAVAYCLEGRQVASVYAREGRRTHFAYVGGNLVSTAWSDSGPVRPETTLAQFLRPAAEPGYIRYLVPTVVWHGQPQRARLAVFGSLNFSATDELRARQAHRDLGEAVVTGVATRDLDSDGVDEVVASGVTVSNPCIAGRPCLQATGTQVTAYYADERRSGPVFSGAANGDEWNAPMLAVGDFDRDSMRIRATGNVYRFVTGADVNAVVAAPPTWRRPGVTHAGGSETTFGQSNGEGETNGGELTYGGSISVGVGVSLYKLVELFGYLNASFGIVHSWTLQNFTTYAQSLTAGEEADLVSYSRAIYVSHEYEVVAHPDPEVLARRMTIDEVDSVVQTTVSLARFRATIPDADQLVPPGLIQHTVGRPDTYLRPGTCNQAALQAGVGTGAISKVYESPSLTEVGEAPSGYRTMSVDVATQSETGVDVNAEVGFEVGGALVVGGTVTGYVGGGYGYRKTITSSATYSGSVGLIAEGYGLDTRFQWGLCLYHWADRSEGAELASYPIVTYVVQPY